MRVDDNTDDNAGASNVRSIIIGTDAGTYSGWHTDLFPAFATSTIFTTPARGLEHGAAYDRQSDYGPGR
jgi:hypothetical protein